jgi:hypothetical protein
MQAFTQAQRRKNNKGNQEGHTKSIDDMMGDISEAIN